MWLFPRGAWLASLRRALRDAPDVRLDYGDPRGAPELRRALARYLGRVRGVAADPERVVVTSGMAQGMARVRTGAGRPGRCAGSAIEDPSSEPGRAQLEVERARAERRAGGRARGCGWTRSRRCPRPGR